MPPPVRDSDVCSIIAQRHSADGMSLSVPEMPLGPATGRAQALADEHTGKVFGLTPDH